MDTGVIVALLASFGVVGSALIQWKSNRDSIVAANAREQALRRAARDQRDEEMQRIREEHSHALALKKQEQAQREQAERNAFTRQQELSEQEARRNTNRAALRALDQFRVASQRLPGGSPSASKDWERAMLEAMAGVDDARVDILFHSGGGIGAAFLTARDTCLRILELGQEWRSSSEIVGKQIKDAWVGHIFTLDSRIDRYLEAIGAIMSIDEIMADAPMHPDTSQSGVRHRPDNVQQ